MFLGNEKSYFRFIVIKVLIYIKLSCMLCYQKLNRSFAGDEVPVRQ